MRKNTKIFNFTENSDFRTLPPMTKPRKKNFARRAPDPATLPPPLPADPSQRLVRVFVEGY